MSPKSENTGKMPVLLLRQFFREYVPEIDAHFPLRMNLNPDRTFGDDGFRFVSHDFRSIEPSGVGVSYNL